MYPQDHLLVSKTILLFLPGIRQVIGLVLVRIQAIEVLFLHRIAHLLEAHLLLEALFLHHAIPLQEVLQAAPLVDHHQDVHLQQVALQVLDLQEVAVEDRHQIIS